MSEHLPDVKDLTPEQEARAAAMANDMQMNYFGLYSAARVIVHLQDRVAELERHLNKATIERAWAIGMLRNPPQYLSRERVQELASKSGLTLYPGWVHDGRGRNNLECFMERVIDEVTGRATSTRDSAREIVNPSCAHCGTECDWTTPRTCCATAIAEDKASETTPDGWDANGSPVSG